ncbi:glycosyltransferase [Spirosoma sp. KUDC1026]|uniref:glycosyltransferase n=1 Tax=Spirosoma sp. KUDC1026 TaxID=2745947 RepID=UPI00159BED3F|nr:glycosyltransferase [Spirosoma sp. KUDC1026]QKZ14540.1 glycosyltransferase [Spirosoma sp. KUDC1026]
MFLFLLLLSLAYALFTTTLWITWLRMPALRPPAHLSDGPLITVIIPVRNEENTIGQLLADLSQQTYSRLDVIVADDSSTDNTRSVVEQYTLTANFPLRLLALTNEQTASPKKRAISQSIALAQGELIITTDGDCRVGPGWLASFAAFYQESGAKLISGPVTFSAGPGQARPGQVRPNRLETSFFDALQTVEFSSLIGSGACTLALGQPTMCNGANLCYEKRVFTEVGGFAGVDHLASGDDEFLMHKVARQYPDGVRFLKSEAAIVSTEPHQSWRAFYNQRKRWASKWRAYDSYVPSLLAVFIFLCNASPILALLGWWLGFLNGSMAGLVIALKLLPEFLFLRQVLVFLQKRWAVKYIPLTQLVYPFYVLFFGLAAQGKGYQWKGRQLR